MAGNRYSISQKARPGKSGAGLGHFALFLQLGDLVEKRAAAKKAKDWGTADAIRDQLTQMGWAVKDTAQGPQISKL